MTNRTSRSQVHISLAFPRSRQSLNHPHAPTRAPGEPGFSACRSRHGPQSTAFGVKGPWRQRRVSVMDTMERRTIDILHIGMSFERDVRTCRNEPMTCDLPPGRPPVGWYSMRAFSRSIRRGAAHAVLRHAAFATAHRQYTGFINARSRRAGHLSRGASPRSYWTNTT